MDIKDITVVNQKNELSEAVDYQKVCSEYLTSLGCKLPEAQKTQFINIARSFQLNPFKREIYAVPYGESFNVIVGFETYLKRAERTGLLSGWKVWTEGEGQNIKAVIEIHRKDFDFPFLHEVYLTEYSTGKSMWAKAPKTMIKKVAMSQGFRLCFPDDVGGLPYTEEEMAPESDNEPIPATVIAEETTGQTGSVLFKNKSFEEEKE